MTSALLLLPMKMARADKERRVDNLLAELVRGREAAGKLWGKLMGSCGGS
jgi:hypothetical protein